MYTVDNLSIAYDADWMQGRVTEPENWKKATPICFHPEGSPLANNPQLYSDNHFNFSFATQLAVTQSELKRVSVEGGVTGYFYSANSAAPLAHTLRGYFDALEVQSQPIITHIEKTPRVKRLKHVIRHFNITDAVVIDQFACTGSTILDASQKLVEAGINQERVFAIGTRVFHQLYEGDDDAKNCKFASLKPEKNALAALFYEAGQQLGSLALKTKHSIHDSSTI